MVRINLIAGMDRNRNIGFNGDMPWGKTMKSDLERFKELTSNKMIVMGRKTFESLPGILPFRAHIVLTNQDLSIRSPFVTTYKSVEDVLKLIAFEDEEVFIIGGAQVYEQFLPHADRIYITKICASLEGDTQFPSIVGRWNITKGEVIHPEGDGYPSQYITYDRVKED